MEKDKEKDKIEIYDWYLSTLNKTSRRIYFVEEVGKPSLKLKQLFVKAGSQSKEAISLATEEDEIYNILCSIVHYTKVEKDEKQENKGGN
ncbi:hypothetical protein ES705_33137 [subsurface metagenome]